MSTFDKVLDSLHGWRGFLAVVLWSLAIPVLIWVAPKVLSFIVELIFPNGW